MAKGNYIKLIFGLKLKQLRLDKNLSLTDLASKSSLSVSYLNEIESGKKYPKSDKIATLAEALNVSYDKLVSLKLMRNLAPVEDLLESNILEKLPLDHYGIDVNKMIGMMSGSSMQLSALIATFIETARGSEMSSSSFSRTALRTFKEFNDNYFDDLEKAVVSFIKAFRLTDNSRGKFDFLKTLLEENFNYIIDVSALNEFSELGELRAVAVKSKVNRLLLNKKLSDAQKTFIVGQELAYNYLGIKDRSFVYSSMKLDTFDQLVNYFKASYFSTALIIDRKTFIDDLASFFDSPKWNGGKLLSLIEKYNATPEMFFQRLTNLSSKYLGINKFFFFRFNYNTVTDKYDLSKELRLNTRRIPGGYQNDEHYCRRWISIETLNKLRSYNSTSKDVNGNTAGILHSKFFGSDEEYVSLSVAQKDNLKPGILSSVTIGFQLDDELKNKVKFLHDPAIRFRIVNDTCEQCKIIDCAERVAPPVSIEKTEKALKIEEALRKLIESI